MFDTNIVIIGNVMTAPEWRRTTNTGSLVANFKVASTSRRLDRETGRWIDGNTLRVRVNCWRKLAEGIASSVMVGDPVVVAGRLYTRDWTDADGNPRTMYEMEAVAVGHDLARGRGSFRRNRPTLGTSAVEDSEAEAQVHGVPAEQLAEEDVPVRYGDGIGDDDPGFDEVPASGPDRLDPVVVIRGGGFTPDDMPGSGNRGDRPGTDRPDGSEADDVDRPGTGRPDRPEADRSDRPEADRPEPLGGTSIGEDGRGAGESGESGEPVESGEPGESATPRRPRRSGRRIPVPA